MKKQGKDVEEEKAKKAKESGRFYRFMIDHAKSVFADPKRVCPAYDPAEGFEVAGFVWFQGFNDLVDGGTYPTGPDGKTRDYSQYSGLMADFIRDVRKDLDAPEMPFVIGVLGVGGHNANENTIAFREAMAAPASMPEFKGNVTAVETAPFWAEELAAIDEKRAKVKQMGHLLKVEAKGHPNAAGSMDAAHRRNTSGNTKPNSSAPRKPPCGPAALPTPVITISAAPKPSH